MTKKQIELARRKLNALLAADNLRPVNDREWAAVEDQGCVEEMARSEAGFTRAVNFLREERETFGDPSLALTRQSPPDMGEQAQRRRARHKRQRTDVADAKERRWHEWAVSNVLSTLASRDDDVGHGRDVRAFRTEVLGGKLLPYEEKPLQDWITAQAAKEGPITLGSLLSATRRLAGILEYITPEADWVQRIPVARHSDLDRLRELSEKLAAFYPWSLSQAATFVLTGIMPWVHSLRSETSLKSPLYVRSRVHLILDPFCTPQEVAAAYISARRNMLPFVKGRMRRLSERHARLAGFVFERGEETTREVFDAWNNWCAAEGKPWEYEHLSQFSRDALQAMDRLLNFGTSTRRGRADGGVDLIHN